MTALIPLETSVADAAAKAVPAAASGPDLAAFISSQYRPLVRTMTLYLGDQHDAEDIAQEALARACRDWARVGGLEQPALWVRRVAFNLANSHFRRWRSRQRAYSRLEGLSTVDLAATGDHADALAVRHALAQLPERQRLVLVLRYFEGMSIAEMSGVLGCPDGTTKSHLSRATAALRRTGLDADDTEDADG